MKGKFVTFEGIEGCGKSTQLSMLADWLLRIGHEVVTTREPGGTRLGEEIRQLLRSGSKNDVFSSRAELLLFEASRAQHMEELILPALKDGKFVLCDRFYDSTVVYQCAARGVDGGIVNFLNEFASFDRCPDMTIIPDISVQESSQRLVSRQVARDRIEQEDEQFFEKVRAGYMNMAENDSRFFVVDGVGDIEKIHESIKNEFSKRFLQFCRLPCE